MVSPVGVTSLFPKMGKGPFFSDWQDAKVTAAVITNARIRFISFYFILKGIVMASDYKPLSGHILNKLGYEYLEPVFVTGKLVDMFFPIPFKMQISWSTYRTNDLHLP